MTNASPRRRSLFLTMLRGSLNARRGRLALAVGAIAIGTSVAAALLLVSVDVGRKVQQELRAYGPNLILAPAAGELAVGAREMKVGALGGEPRFGPATLAWLEGEQREGRIAKFTTVRYAIGRAHGRPIVVAGTMAPVNMIDLSYRKRAMPRSEPGAKVVVRAVIPDGPWVGASAARVLGVQDGGSIELGIQTRAGVRTLGLADVVVFETGGAEDQQVFVSSSRLDSVLGSPGRFHVALARADGDAASVLAYANEATARAPQGALPAGASLRAVKRLTQADGAMLERIRLLLILVTIVALVAAALCAMSTLADLVLERTPEIALLRSLGAGRRDLLGLFLGEAATLGLVGGIGGLAIGLVAAQAIGWGVFGSSIRPTPVVLPITLGLGVLTALIASVAPVRDALAVEPARVLRGE